MVTETESGSERDTSHGAASGSEIEPDRHEPVRDARFPLRSFVGFDVEVVEPGRSRAAVTVTHRHHNPNGVVHGGVVFTLVDTGMGAATMSLLDGDTYCASIEVQVRFLRPVVAGELVADTEVLRRGRRVAHLESRVRDGDGRLVATAAGSFALIDPTDPAS